MIRLLRVVLVSVLALSFAAATASQSPTILVLGDSISAAYGIAPSSGWVALMRERLAEHGLDYEVINASISGETTQQGRVRLPAALERHEPAIVIIELGVNDGMRGLPLETMQTNLTAMVEQAQAAGARALLLGVRLPARYDENYRRRFASVLLEVADTTGAAFVPHVLAESNQHALAGRREHLLGGGSVHPNAQGHALILDNVWPALSALGVQTCPTLPPAKSAR